MADETTADASPSEAASVSDAGAPTAGESASEPTKRELAAEIKALSEQLGVEVPKHKSNHASLLEVRDALRSQSERPADPPPEGPGAEPAKGAVKSSQAPPLAGGATRAPEPPPHVRPEPQKPVAKAKPPAPPEVPQSPSSPPQRGGDLLVAPGKSLTSSRGGVLSPGTVVEPEDFGTNLERARERAEELLRRGLLVRS